MWSLAQLTFPLVCARPWSGGGTRWGGLQLLPFVTALVTHPAMTSPLTGKASEAHRNLLRLPTQGPAQSGWSGGDEGESEARRGPLQREAGPAQSSRGDAGIRVGAGCPGSRLSPAPTPRAALSVLPGGDRLPIWAAIHCSPPASPALLPS